MFGDQLTGWGGGHPEPKFKNKCTLFFEIFWFERDKRRCYNAGRTTTTTNKQLKIELLSQWKLEAEFRKCFNKCVKLEKPAVAFNFELSKLWSNFAFLCCVTSVYHAEDNLANLIQLVFLVRWVTRRLRDRETQRVRERLRLSCQLKRLHDSTHPLTKGEGQILLCGFCP